MAGHINLLKLCVGIDTPDDLIAWRNQHCPSCVETRHITRMWPKRGAEILGGGSLYWVMRGVIQARQRILRLDEAIGPDGIRRCAIVMDRELIRTHAARRRPFQGWRYLTPEDSPADLPKNRAEDDALPPELSTALSDMGVL